jgi:hypothetical protein
MPKNIHFKHVGQLDPFVFGNSSYFLYLKTPLIKQTKKYEKPILVLPGLFYSDRPCCPKNY